MYLRETEREREKETERQVSFIKNLLITENSNNVFLEQIFYFGVRSKNSHMKTIIPRKFLELLFKHIQISQTSFFSQTNLSNKYWENVEKIGKSKCNKEESKEVRIYGKFIRDLFQDQEKELFSF